LFTNNRTSQSYPVKPVVDRIAKLQSSCLSRKLIAMHNVQKHSKTAQGPHWATPQLACQTQFVVDKVAKAAGVLSDSGVMRVHNERGSMSVEGPKPLVHHDMKVSGRDASSWCHTGFHTLDTPAPLPAMPGSTRACWAGEGVVGKISEAVLSASGMNVRCTCKQNKPG